MRPILKIPACRCQGGSGTDLNPADRRQGERHFHRSCWKKVSWLLCTLATEDRPAPRFESETLDGVLVQMPTYCVLLTGSRTVGPRGFWRGESRIGSRGVGF